MRKKQLFWLLAIQGMNSEIMVNLMGVFGLMKKFILVWAITLV